MKQLLMFVFCLIPSFALAEETSLPNDADQAYISLVGERAAALFDAPAFAELRKTCHVVPVSKESAVFTDRYGTGPYAIKSDNAIRVQLSDGQVVFQAEGDELNANATVMAGCIRLGLLKKIFQPFHKHRTVVVDPPKTVPSPKPAETPEIREKTEGGNEEEPFYVLISLLAGMLCGEIVSFCKKVEQ
jgi:hypothetical protein